MFRTRLYAALGYLLCCAPMGCTHFLETKAIEHFTAALQSKNLDALKTAASDEFEHKALRHEASLEDIEILNLPDGKTTIVKVEDESPDRKRVTVAVGKNERKLLYKLTREGPGGKWVVDDIVVKQQRQGVTAAKSVTEQMDLLLTVREFLAAWQNGGRNEVLSTATSEFGQVLGELPPNYLGRLARQVTAPEAKSNTVRPEAQLDDDVAIVRLRRAAGELVLTFKLRDGRWKVSDAAVAAKGTADHIPSVAKLATVMNTAVAFLEAYRAENKQALTALTTPRFHECLLPADLSAVELPAVELLAENVRVKYEGNFANLVVPRANEYVQLSLVRENREEADGPVRYVVEEVSLFEIGGQEEKRLSALFTARAVMQLFAHALAQRDLPMLRQLASPDFDERIWRQIDERSFAELPLEHLPPVIPEVIATKFQGAVTEFTVRQGENELTYVLRNWNGKVRVDDVLSALPGRPHSLKSTLEIMLPVHSFAAGLGSGQLDVLQRNSSGDFNRLIWKQGRKIPNVGQAAASYMRSPLAEAEIAADRALVVLGDDHFGAQVDLVKEAERWVIDEVVLIAGVEPQQRGKLKQTLRVQLANGLSVRVPNGTGLEDNTPASLSP
jgi:hypothetical protein